MANTDKKTVLWALFQEMAADVTLADQSLRGHFNALITRYEEPHRGYHNITHLVELCEEFNKHRKQFAGCEAAIIGALFYHDAIYNCQPGQDEEDSAILAEQELKTIGLAEDQIKFAAQIIRDTANHATDTNYAAKLFLDMDMAILAADRARYKDYVRGVTREFCTKLGLSETQFGAARESMFLQPVLNGKALFTTKEYKPLENKARANIKAELNGFT